MFLLRIVILAPRATSPNIRLFEDMQAGVVTHEAATTQRAREGKERIEKLKGAEAQDNCTMLWQGAGVKAQREGENNHCGLLQEGLHSIRSALAYTGSQ
jgi:hypothetical protein